MELEAGLKVFLSDPKKSDERDPHLDNLCTKDVNVLESCESEKYLNDDESKHNDSRKRPLDFSEMEKFCDDSEVKCAVEDLEGDKNESDLDDDLCSDDVDVTKCVVNSLAYARQYHDEEKKKAWLVETNNGENYDDGDKEYVLIEDSSDEDKNESCNKKKADHSSHKRKHDFMWKMWSWVNVIAKDPCDSVVGSLPDKSRWNSYGNEELWKQVLSYREAVFLKRHGDSSSEQSIGEKNQKMHPCMYDDHIGSSYNLRERISCSKKTYQAGASFKSPSLGAQNDSCKGGTESHDEKELVETTDSTTSNSVFDYNAENHIPVGPGFQAEVPEWTDGPSETDVKWMGTRVWPLQKVEQKFLIERDPIGKGRQDACGCQVRGSIECIRFHITEKRCRLKFELGSAFHNWKFDKMGEEVMLSWTSEEQKKFKNIVRSNPPSSENHLWDQIFKLFPSKSREELVSYYFNVFLLQCRAHQNRSTPCHIDSDCESEVGSVACSSLHETMESWRSILLSPKKKHKKSR